MCEPATITMAATALAAGAAVYSAANQPKFPGAPPMPAAPGLPQGSKLPDQAAVRRQGTGATPLPGASAASTMLTGATGISPDLLNLGKNTLLGA